MWWICNSWPVHHCLLPSDCSSAWKWNRSPWLSGWKTCPKWFCRCSGWRRVFTWTGTLPIQSKTLYICKLNDMNIESSSLVIGLFSFRMIYVVTVLKWLFIGLGAFGWYGFRDSMCSTHYIIFADEFRCIFIIVHINLNFISLGAGAWMVIGEP